MSVGRGDVVLVDYPYSDRTGTKVRPALVVQADFNHQRLDDTIIASITSRLHGGALEPTQFLIDITTVDGRQSGLRLTSVVKCENLLTVDQRFILRILGQLPARLMPAIDACLKAALDLP